MTNQQTPSQNSPRATVVILVCPINGRRSFHFCAIELLQGSNNDLWWPLADGADLFSAIEEVMTVNGIAHNVTDVTPIAVQGKCTDYRVTFNKVERNGK